MYTCEQIPNRKVKKFRILDSQGNVYLSELSFKKSQIILGDLHDLHEYRQQQSHGHTVDETNQRIAEPNNPERVRDHDSQRFFDQKEEQYYRESAEAARAREAASERTDRASERTDRAREAISASLSELCRLNQEHGRLNDLARQARLLGATNPSKLRSLEPETINVKSENVI